MSASRRTFRASQRAQGILADKRPELPRPARNRAGREPGEEGSSRGEGEQPLVALEEPYRSSHPGGGPWQLGGL